MPDGTPARARLARGLTAERDELLAEMKQLPFNHPERGRYAGRIRQLERTIDIAEGLMNDVTVTTVIVGTSFKGFQAKTALAEMKVGDLVRLVREQNNRHDPLAVACHYRGAHVGYVPKQANGSIATALDCGIEVQCIVTEPPVIVQRRTGPAIITEPKLTVTWRP